MFQYCNIYRREKIIALVMIITGGIIYVLYRPQNLLLFRVTDNLGLTPYIEQLRNEVVGFYMPPFVINSLPAGLWTASYLTFMFVSTRYHNRKTRLLLSLPLPVSAIILEFMQLTGWCPGTFDFFDLLCYVIPLIIFIKNV